MNPNRLPYESLEEIHIFVLANILRRSIIILSEGVIRSIQGSSMSPNNSAGVYLPLLWESKDCLKHPIVLGYNEQHFNPLVPPETDDVNAYVVPLVNFALEPYVVHFTTDSEQRTVNFLLQEYLETTEITYTRKEGLAKVVCAKLHKSNTAPEFDVSQPYLQQIEDLFRQEYQENQQGLAGHSLAPNSFEENLGPNLPTNVDMIQPPSLSAVPCDTAGCPFFALPEHGCLCSACLQKYLEGGSTRRPVTDQTVLMRVSPRNQQQMPQVAPSAPLAGSIQHEGI
jgi:tumor necrosis factor alpha-induced protein 3